MIRILVLLLAVVTGVASYYLMKKSAAFLPLLKKETLLSIGFIFFVLLLSTLFSLTFAKKMS